MRTQSRRSLVWALALAAIAAQSGVAQNTTNITFDTDPVGLPPAGWSTMYNLGEGSTVMVTSAQFVSAPNSLELTTVGQAAYPTTAVDLRGLGGFFPADSNAYVRFSIMLAQNTDQQARFDVENLNWYYPLMQLKFNNGSIWAQDSDNLYPGTRLKPIGHILDPDFSMDALREFRPCSYYGRCIGCDTKVKNNRFQSLYDQNIPHTSVEIRNIQMPPELLSHPEFLPHQQAYIQK